VAILFAGLCALPTSTAVRDLQIVTPLQALTIPDGGFDTVDLSRRQAFLERFRAGVEAEMKVLDRKKNLYYDGSTAITAGVSAAAGLDFLSDKEAERAFEMATSNVAAQQETRRKLQTNGFGGGGGRQKQQQYQFVGVIQPAGDSSSTTSSTGGGGGGAAATISWYARPKPKDARWSMRLVHVNREAVIKHLFDQGKVDIYGKYQTVVDAETGERKVESKYTVTPRSWR
jgi:hypothetical protein